MRLKFSEASNKRYRQVTVVLAAVPGVRGGLLLADALEGFRAWNVEHLEAVRMKNGKWVRR